MNTTNCGVYHTCYYILHYILNSRRRRGRRRRPLANWCFEYDVYIYIYMYV